MHADFFHYYETMMLYKRLRSYAEWYYTKYFPSRKMLHEKLMEKSEPDIVDEVMREIESLIVERNNIESRVHMGMQAGKSLRYIKTKLKQKKFDPDMVSDVLESYAESFSEPSNYQRKIEQIIQKRKNQCWSRQKISYELKAQYPEMKSTIEELLIDYDDGEVLNEKIPALLKKYTQEKVVGKCMQE